MIVSSESAVDLSQVDGRRPLQRPSRRARLQQPSSLPGVQSISLASTQPNSGAGRRFNGRPRRGCMPAGPGRPGRCSRPLLVCFCDELAPSRQPTEPSGQFLPVRAARMDKCGRIAADGHPRCGGSGGVSQTVDRRSNDCNRSASPAPVRGCPVVRVRAAPFQRSNRIAKFSLRSSYRNDNGTPAVDLTPPPVSLPSYGRPSDPRLRVPGVDSPVPFHVKH